MKLQDKPPYVHIVANRNIIKAIKQNIAMENTFMVCLDGKKMKYNGGFFKLFYEAFQFPDYMIKDWTFFDEAMHELDWIETEKFILVIDDADQVLSGLGMNSYRKQFWDIMSGVIAEWVRGRNYDDFPTLPTSFHLVLIVPKGKQKRFASKLKKLLHLEINSCEGEDVFRCF